MQEKIKCLYCGKEFIRHKGGKPQVYCSSRCRRHYWRKVIGKEKNKIIQKKQDDKQKLVPARRFYEIKYQAGIRKHSFSLTFDEFMTFWNGTCHYCGNKIEGVGIDRIDSSLGYTMNNCVPCCTECNIMKNTRNYKDFIQKCKQIVLNLGIVG